MNAYKFSKLRQEQLSKISLKGKSQKKIRDLLIQFSNGLAEHLFRKYQNYPRIHLNLPELGDYQSLVYQACLRTVAVYDYYRWKKLGDKKAKARIQKWRNGHKFIPRTKQIFKHMGHIYGYMYLTADTDVRIEMQRLRQDKRFGMEVSPSQYKNLDSKYQASFFEMVMGPTDDQELETKLFHREIMDQLPNWKALKSNGKIYTFEDLYYFYYVEELTYSEIMRRTGCHQSTVKKYIQELNEQLIPILEERRAA